MYRHIDYNYLNNFVFENKNYLNSYYIIPGDNNMFGIYVVSIAYLDVQVTRFK